MARYWYGGTSADFALDPDSGRVVPGAQFTVWTQRTGGIQITDLLDADGVAATTVTADAQGRLYYQSFDGDKSVHWLDTGQGLRIAVRPVDLVGPQGETGASAYEAAVAEGFVGDETAWLASLVGPKGDTGAAGPAIGGLLTTKGDLAVHNGSAVVRKPVGADGTVLLADSAQADGSRWGSVGNLLTSAQARYAAGIPPIVAAANGVTMQHGSLSWASATQAMLADVTSSSPRIHFGGTSSGSTAYLPVTADVHTAAFLVSTSVVGASAAAIAYLQDEIGVPGTSTTIVGAAVPIGETPAWLTVMFAPAGKRAVSIAVRPQGVPVGASFRVHKAGFWSGAGGLWMPPGPPVPNLGSWIVEAADTGRACYVWDQVNSRPQMVYYDSGWRDISSLLVNGWTGSVFLRRADNGVFIRFSALSGAAATSDTVLTVPTGFRSEATINHLMPATGTDTTVVRAQMTSSGVVSISPRAAATAVSTTWAMSTTNALPTTLPGTASGSIPAA